ncbi:MAG: hypothetical protein JWO32_232 [Bacteroidetes bacterium]|nr:hypothetical protein [Bacteroidota bacterium]
MKREEAIKKFLSVIKKDILAKVVFEMAQNEPHNYPLQLLKAAFKITDDETINNWFTSLGVLVVHERLYSGTILQKAHSAAGFPPMNGKAKKELLNLIATGAKLTKADAG